MKNLNKKLNNKVNLFRKIKHMKISPEVFPLLGIVSAGLILGTTYFTHLLTSHNDVYVDQSVPLRERFDKDVPVLLTKENIHKIKIIPFFSDPNLKNPFENKYPNNIALEEPRIKEIKNNIENIAQIKDETSHNLIKQITSNFDQEEILQDVWGSLYNQHFYAVDQYKSNKHPSSFNDLPW
eukprot:TRINITY_DN249_c0_g1_i1.p1 TRINITY_DN249_c0_g1~~TRINITY_DN249_c0_g1_i1.p1  ORF type:complete len:181 (-),score=40.92 TRINITY_DN249_c0_g1_i1:103-645(-)